MNCILNDAKNNKEKGRCFLWIHKNVATFWKKEQKKKQEKKIAEGRRTGVDWRIGCWFPWRIFTEDHSVGLVCSAHSCRSFFKRTRRRRRRRRWCQRRDSTNPGWTNFFVGRLATRTDHFFYLYGTGDDRSGNVLSAIARFQIELRLAKLPFSPCLIAQVGPDSNFSSWFRAALCCKECCWWWWWLFQLFTLQLPDKTLRLQALNLKNLVVPCKHACVCVFVRGSARGGNDGWGWWLW